jgi:PBP1b-binding outer membrane lipoprotein LpoB
MKKLLSNLFVLLVLTGCSHTPVKSQDPITGKTSTELDNLGQTLSQADDKNVIIRKWIEANVK